MTTFDPLLQKYRQSANALLGLGGSTPQKPRLTDKIGSNDQF
ncbi:hypothetical protein MYAER_0522 [Microcystis aeruginosa NIES-2549]|uniref:Uncharacterized protein n=1 Tax=Microcystis aeruginosa NIES-2549 TaxID=1641812 RepID=A0A0F6U1E7_MICAE|nr:hypothetical protein MYAER_0522 [Microcystis aeruginosa NIES-2549]AOC51273.1 hypothetical protein amyaer_0524 [Microcystis aeruginosa NIES-2481]